MRAKKIIIRLLVGLCVAVAVVGSVKAYQMYYDRKVPNFTGKTDLYVYPWMEPQAVCDSILATGLVKQPASLQRVFKDVESIKPGHYVIDPTCSSIYVTRMLHLGWQTPVNLTLSGAIRTSGVLARKIGAQMMVDSAAVADFAFCADSIGLDPALLFTRIIPDTYQMTWTASVKDIFARLFKERDAWWTPERVAAAKAQGLTPEEASTLASIVDGETRYVPEQPTIAGVYLNRLKTGMKLQADPTVAYCFDYEPRRILRWMLLVDNPYNTYMYAGLPPGPISCPPKSCLEAAIHPEDHSYIYFCADPSFNGSHRFAVTYTEHLQNARAFQKALNERQKAAQ
jgi:UPF0755 protein